MFLSDTKPFYQDFHFQEYIKKKNFKAIQLSTPV